MNVDNHVFSARRQRMVENQLKARNIEDVRVLEAMRSVPRHCFVPPDYVEQAYADGPLPIGYDQTISQPYIVALMSQLLDLSGDENVLEVGTGSGYQAAVLAHLVRSVHTIERHAPLAQRAEAIIRELGLTNVQIHIGDGSQGLPEFAPYHAILVTAAAPKTPQPLLDQLIDGGRLVLPVGSRWSGQVLEKWQRHAERFSHRNITSVAFVPLRGQHGWSEEEE